MWVVALHAEFDQYIDAPVPAPSVTLLQDWITGQLPANIARNTAFHCHSPLLTRPVRLSLPVIILTLLAANVSSMLKPAISSIN